MKENLIDKENKNKKTGTYDLWHGITLPSRIILTLYSFYGLFFIYNLIIQYILLIAGLLFETTNLAFKIILSSVFCIFSISSANILVIPTFEFFSFNLLMNKNPLSHLQSFIYIYQERKFDENKINEKNYIIINVFFVLIGLLYVIGLLLGYSSMTIKFKDYIKIIILIIIYTYYLTILLCYFFMSFYLFIKIIPIKCSRNFYKFWNYGTFVIKKLNLYFKDKPLIPRINLYSSIINPFIMNNYKKDGIDISEDFMYKWYFEDCIFGLGLIIKLFIIMISIIVFGFILYTYKVNIISILIFICLFLVMSILSISLNFPFLYRNRKTFGTCRCRKADNNIIFTDIVYKITEDKEGEGKNGHPFLISITRFIWDVILILVTIGLLGIYFLKKDDDSMKNIFENITPSESSLDTKNLLLPNICFSSIHNIPLQLYLPFINDAYYYNNIYKEIGPHYESSLQIQKYKQLFFNDDYEINVRGNLIKEDNIVKMVQYNVRNKKNYVTILSIKGTSYNRDIYIDAQLYCSSVFLSILSTFSILSTKDSPSRKIIEFSFSIPYRLFFKYLMIDGYLNKLQDAYRENEFTFYNNVVIVGHSLGGGLAKLFGRLMQKQAISLSGPGVNAFHSLWKYDGKSENFEISAIDLVPDMDLVPRVEISGGTIYRIVCKKGPASCHSKHLSLCEVLIMCRNPNSETYCKNIAGLKEEEIQEIFEGSKLDNKNN